MKWSRCLVLLLMFVAAAAAVPAFRRLLCSCPGSGGTEGNKRLVVFHAGSLSVPFKRIAADFMNENPGVEVELEPAGSRACARKITDLGRRCDVLAAADYTVIDDLLIPGHASWNIRFASNEMAIAYDEGSARSGSIDGDNWPDILLDPDVAFGRSDPDSDPCGYRAVLTIKLAESYYGRKGLTDALLAKDGRFIRPKETDLLALLETHAIDYIFIYRSVAEQHGLKTLLLPDEINLKDPRFADRYGKVEVAVSGKTPGTKIIKKGAPMVYGVTIPSCPPHPRLALAFLEFLLDGSKGMAVMAECGQPSVVPSGTDTYGMIPEPLKRFARPAGGER